MVRRAAARSRLPRGGQANGSGASSAGNSGTVTISTGPGGAASGGSAPGVSGNLLLKTGTGGGNAAASSTGGNAGHIILQPGNGGSGSTQGTGGSTIIRASNSGDIFSVQDNAGSSTLLGVSNSGNLRVGTTMTTARVNLGAGSATLPPLRFTAGTNLTTPQSGAMEFDGTNLFITLSDGTRRFLTSDVANVRDFGAAAAGSTDDASAIQDAIDSLVPTGGVAYFPPGFKYIIGSQINIQSQLPIWVISHMSASGYGSTLSGTTQMAAKAVIQPKSGLTGSMFCWNYVDGLFEDSFGYGGPGGGISGIRFVDWNGSESRNTAFEAAIHVKAAGYFTIRDCNFGGLKASAIKVTESVICQILHCKAHQCGDAGSPVLDIGGTLGTAAVNDGSISPGHMELGVDTVNLDLPDSDRIPVGAFFTIAGESGSPMHIVTARTGNPTTSITFDPELLSGVTDNAVITFYPVAGVYAAWLFLEAAFGNYTVKVHANSGGLTGDHLYFENTGENDHTVFIDADGGVNLSNITFNGNDNTAIVMRAQRSTLRNVSGTTYADTLPIIKVDAPLCVLSGIDIDGLSTTGQAILITANGIQSRLSDIFFFAAGAIDASASAYVMLSNIYLLGPTCAVDTFAIDLAFGCILTGAFIDGGHIEPTVQGSVCNGIRAAGSTITGVRVQRLDGGNGVVSTSSADVITGNHCSVLNGGTPFVPVAGAQFWGNHADTGAPDLARVRESIDVPLFTLRETDGNADVGNAAANGGVLASDTTPALSADSQNSQQIIWPAGNTDWLAFQVPLPEGFDGNSDVLIDFTVHTDNSGGGGIDSVGVFVVWAWDGENVGSDFTLDSSPSVTPHTLTVTISAADIPDNATRLSVRFGVDAHANDPTILRNVRVRVVKTLAAV
jgi:hypothetical protein